MLILAVLLGVTFEFFFFSAIILGASLICIGFIAALIECIWEAIKENQQKKNLEQKSYQKVTDDFAKDSPLHEEKVTDDFAKDSPLHEEKVTDDFAKDSPLYKEKVRNNGNLNSNKINSKLLFLIKALPFMCLYSIILLMYLDSISKLSLPAQRILVILFFILLPLELFGGLIVLFGLFMRFIKKIF